MVWPVNGRGKQLFYLSLLGDATLNTEKLKAPEQSKVPWFKRRKQPNSTAKLNFVFALIDKANNDRHYLLSVLLQHLFQSHFVERHLFGFFQHL